MHFSREKIHSFHHILKEFYGPEKKNKRLKTTGLRNSLAVQWLGLRTFIAEGQGQSLVGELRFCKPSGSPKQINKILKSKNTKLQSV